MTAFYQAVQSNHHPKYIVDHSPDINPRPDGVWRVARPDGGGPKGPPPYLQK